MKKPVYIKSNDGALLWFETGPIKISKELDARLKVLFDRAK